MCAAGSEERFRLTRQQGHPQRPLVSRHNLIINTSTPQFNTTRGLNYTSTVLQLAFAAILITCRASNYTSAVLQHAFATIFFACRASSYACATFRYSFATFCVPIAAVCSITWTIYVSKCYLIKHTSVDFLVYGTYWAWSVQHKLVDYI